jgi:hypothetical protein
MRARDVPALHTGVEKWFSAYAIEIVVKNTGVLAAKHVVVELRSGNARLHSRPFLVDVFGPPPPSTERDILGNLSRLSHQVSRPDRTSFVLENSENVEVQVEFRCEDFRHGRAQTLCAVLELTDRTADAAHVEVRITASNMRGDVTERLIVACTETDTVLGELVDLDEVKIRVEPPTWGLLLKVFHDDEDSIVHYRNDGTKN